ncbi:hypothetical protein BB561_000002 [Smittium simulii]|uniref:Uncharacterized protein n=1 Tax=Smittium simulii TaxID=133385 RepID=A0A2T9Z0Y1_9FUNG|nr:hypothetical protein BB561_000002 [Smittium simulii]
MNSNNHFNYNYSSKGISPNYHVTDIVLYKSQASALIKLESSTLDNLNYCTSPYSHIETTILPTCFTLQQYFNSNFVIYPAHYNVFYSHLLAISSPLPPHSNSTDFILISFKPILPYSYVIYYGPRYISFVYNTLFSFFSLLFFIFPYDIYTKFNVSTLSNLFKYFFFISLFNCDYTRSIFNALIKVFLRYISIFNLDSDIIERYCYRFPPVYLNFDILIEPSLSKFKDLGICLNDSDIDLMQGIYYVDNCIDLISNWDYEDHLLTSFRDVLKVKPFIKGRAKRVKAMNPSKYKNALGGIIQNVYEGVKADIVAETSPLLNFKLMEKLDTEYRKRFYEGLLKSFLRKWLIMSGKRGKNNIYRI